MENSFNIEEELNKLPLKPGVYLMHDKDDNIIYVGKAVKLRNRVRSYFRNSTKKTAKILKMVSQIAWFEYVVTDSELEALVLENNLIKENMPKYNTMLKDDKTYPYIKVTTNEDYPRIFKTRKVLKDNAKYFGPFTSGESVNETIDLLVKLYKIRMCKGRLKIDSDEIKENKTCLYYHIGQCDAPCIKNISKEEYNKNVQKAIDFLNGNYRPLIRFLEDKMNREAEALDYESAAVTRDLIESVKGVCQKQKITNTDGEDRDIIALARNDDSVIIQMFFVRAGKMVGREHYYMKYALDESNEEILGSFIMQFYLGAPNIPREIVLPIEPSGMELIREWMSEKRGAKVLITIPQKGTKEKLLELCEENAKIKLNQDLEKIKRNYDKTVGAVNTLSKMLSLDNMHRMEAYDISNISGFESVGSMVVFVDGKPKNNDYRKFKIKSVEGPNDYASMEEVLTRRFLHGIKEKSGEENVSKSGFSDMPDLILMDGGRGQVNIALSVLKKLGLDIPVCGMVKDDNHRTRGLYYNNVEIPIDKTSESFKLVTRIQDEAHRFAITFHRNLRSKGQVHSILDDIPGIGEKRRRSLMKNFDSLEDIKNADVETLSKIEGFNEKVAQSVYDFFHK